MMKGRALRRALATTDAHRIGGDLPLITDTTEVITPEKAYELLLSNKNNRPINWQKVEEYAAMMARGEWLLHGQGIVLDGTGNLLTGQKRLWAIIYSNTAVPMRISRGSPPESARLLDRHNPQSARDLAARGTGRKHAPTEASIARGVLVLRGSLRPALDVLAKTIEENAATVAILLSETTGTKKTKAVLMVLAAICAATPSDERARMLARSVDRLADRLSTALHPQDAAACWGRGAAFGLAMESARRILADWPT